MSISIGRRVSKWFVMVGSVLALWGLAPGALAVDGASSVYLLGKRGPLAAFVPKPGWYLTNDVYFYDAGTGEVLPLGDLLVAEADAQALINIAQFTWVSQWSVGGGRLGFSGVLPFGNLEVDAAGSVTGSTGAPLDVGLSDSVTGFGDPAVGAALGWKRRTGEKFRAWSTYGSVFIPVGDYELGRIANLGKNRWAVDVGGAFTMANFKRGRELSSVLGFTFNGDNEDTDYSSGTEMHLELAGKQHLKKGWSGGLVGYWYEQLTGDSNNPELLGDFQGRVFAIGPEISKQFTANKKHPVTLDVRWYHEFDAKNRMEGDSVFLTVSVPLHNPPPREAKTDWSKDQNVE